MSSGAAISYTQRCIFPTPLLSNIDLNQYKQNAQKTMHGTLIVLHCTQPAFVKSVGGVRRTSRIAHPQYSSLGIMLQELAAATASMTTTYAFNSAVMLDC